MKYSEPTHMIVDEVEREVIYKGTYHECLKRKDRDYPWATVMEIEEEPMPERERPTTDRYTDALEKHGVTVSMPYGK